MAESLVTIPGYSDDGGIPSGIICMWSGASDAIPSGWALCDGQNGTPNLVDRFIVGAGSTYNVGDIGGEATHSLSTNEMPSHSHTATLSLSGLKTSSAGAHVHTVDGGEATSFGDGMGYTKYGLSQYGSLSMSTAGAHTHTITGSGTVTISSTGSSTAHENRPPYYALCFIMKL